MPDMFGNLVPAKPLRLHFEPVLKKKSLNVILNDR